MRVLFADDQLPSTNQAENDRCKAELRRELAKDLSNFDADYDEDYEWFTELVRHLVVDMAFELDQVRSFKAAMNRAANVDAYDVAVIDLSWTGDPELQHNEKQNAGLKILRLIQVKNQSARVYKPTIALSQNFERNPELFAQVLEAGALPIPKIYTSTGQRSVAAAIKLMGISRGSGEIKREADPAKIPISELLGKLTTPQLVAFVGGILAFAAVMFKLGKGTWP